MLRNAFALARSGRPGPVYIDMPADILGQLIDEPDYRPAVQPTPPRADPALVRQVAARLAAAERPILVAGGGAIASRRFRRGCCACRETIRAGADEPVRPGHYR